MSDLIGKKFKPIHSGPRERITVLDEADTYVWVQYDNGNKCPISKEFLHDTYELDSGAVPGKGSTWRRRPHKYNHGFRVAVLLSDEDNVAVEQLGQDNIRETYTLRRFHELYENPGEDA